MKEIDDREDALVDMSDSTVVPSSITLHEESIGSQHEFFDDHQKWMIESFDT